MRGKNTLTAWIMAGIGAVFVLWLAVLIAPYAEGGLPGILLPVRFVLRLRFTKPSAQLFVIHSNEKSAGDGNKPTTAPLLCYVMNFTTSRAICQHLF